jgi:hypothetical protein
MGYATDERFSAILQKFLDEVICKGRFAATRIFSPLAVAGQCVSIGRYWYLFKRFTAVSAGGFYRFEHIVSYSSWQSCSKVICLTNGIKERPFVNRLTEIVAGCIIPFQPTLQD